MTGRISEETDGGNLGACLPFPAVLPGPQTGPWPTTMTASPRRTPAENEASLINGYYTRPAIVNLAGDVAGRRILDAGCGSGPLPRRCATGAPP